MALRAVGLAFLVSAALVAPPIGVSAAADDVDGGLTVEVQSLLTSDYIYRGVTLSADYVARALRLRAAAHH